MKSNLEEYKNYNSDEHGANSGTVQRMTSTTEPNTTGMPSIEVVRRSRGRPPGSRNKPKPKVFRTLESMSMNLMRPYILEISPGNDVVEALDGFCRRRNIGITIMNTTGSFSSLTLRQPSFESIHVAESAVTFTGRFEALSITGGIIQPNFASHLAISVAGRQGQIVGGLVVGPMIAADTVTVIAMGYSEPEYVGIPVDEYNTESAPVSGERSEGVEEHQRHRQLAEGRSLGTQSFYEL